MSDLIHQDINTEIVRNLVDEQFPQWADLPLKPLGQAGTDNQIFRLGTDKCVRLPRVDWAAKTPAREQALMAAFQSLPLNVPRPLGLGEPAFGYLWQWSIVSWIEGEALGMRQLSGAEANQLAETILAIRAVPANKALTAGDENYGRGGPLRERDELFRQAARKLSDEVDEAALLRIWEECLSAGEANNQPVYLHGDLHGGNLVEKRGVLVGLIDWGLAGVGDGACDLSAAWCLCDGHARDVFQAALAPTEAEWLRGAGWALSIACIYVAYYRDMPDTNCAMSRRTVRTVLDAFA